MLHRVASSYPATTKEKEKGVAFMLDANETMKSVFSRMYEVGLRERKKRIKEETSSRNYRQQASVC